MRISSLTLLLGVAVSSLLSSGCTGNRQEKMTDITGKWESEINAPDFHGKEYLYLLSDSTVSITDSLLYTANDSKMEVSLGCTVTTSGKWVLREDSLILTLGSTTVEPDSASFNAKSLQTNSSLLQTVSNDDMRKDFCDAISKEIAGTFSARSDKTITLGRVIPVGTDTLILNKGHASLLLTKSPE